MAFWKALELFYLLGVYSVSLDDIFTDLLGTNRAAEAKSSRHPGFSPLRSKFDKKTVVGESVGSVPIVASKHDGRTLISTNHVSK